MVADSYQDIVVAPESLDGECKELQDVMRAAHDCFHGACCSTPSCVKARSALNKAVLAWWNTLRPNPRPGEQTITLTEEDNPFAGQEWLLEAFRKGYARTMAAIDRRVDAEMAKRQAERLA